MPWLYPLADFVTTVTKHAVLRDVNRASCHNACCVLLPFGASFIRASSGDA
jgi:hypothetical protein